MSVSSPATDFAVECYHGPNGPCWFYTWMQNGRMRTSLGSYTTREAAKAAMEAAKHVETRR